LRRHLPLAALAAWAALIFIVSSIPNPPDAGGGDWRYNAAHVVEYTVFGALAAGAFRAYRSHGGALLIVVAAWVLGTAYGVSDEFHQSFVPNRDANAVDVALDSAGSLIGAVAATAFHRWKRG
jgi:VanZ family protein